MEKLKIPYTIIVEGRYDRAKLESIADARVITTDGFSLFNDAGRLALIKRIAQRGKVILLCDSDGGGTQIRSFLTRSLPADSIIQLYTPQIKGKERRKSAPSKAGFLGVEGTDADILRRLLAPYASDAPEKAAGEAVAKADFYECGLSGGNNSSALRDSTAAALALPRGLTANALLAAVNAVCTREEFFAALKTITEGISEGED